MYHSKKSYTNTHNNNNLSEYLHGMLQEWFLLLSLWQTLEGCLTEQEWYCSDEGVHTFEDWMPGAIWKKSFDTGVESHTCYSKRPLYWKRAEGEQNISYNSTPKTKEQVTGLSSAPFLTAMALAQDSANSQVDDNSLGRPSSSLGKQNCCRKQWEWRANATRTVADRADREWRQNECTSLK